MTQSNKLRFCIPFLILFSMLGLLWRELFYSNPAELPSALIGADVPVFQVSTLFVPQRIFHSSELHGRVTLLNVWASWCSACNLEQPMLLKIKNEYHVPIYSLDYKDDPQNAKNYLRSFGNPYELVGKDDRGDVAIDLGVYGTPETFVISPAGKIVYRYIGAIDQKAWDTVLYPLIQKYQS